MKPRPGSAEAKAAKTLLMKGRFLAAYAEHATIEGAARALGIGRRTHYNWLRDDPEYADAFGKAEQSATDALESEARRRAIKGVKEPVFGKGDGPHAGTEIRGYIRKYSDTLLIFLLKAKRPEQFRDRHEITGAGGGPLEVAITKIERVVVDPTKGAT